MFTFPMKPSCSSCVAARKTNTFPAFAIAVFGAASVACTVALLFGAFSLPSENEATTDCIVTEEDSVAMESYKTFLIFAMGYVTTLAIKNRQDIARRADSAICTVNEKLSSAAAYIAACGACFRSQTVSSISLINKEVLAIMFSGLLCTVVIISLICSAFAAEPDTEPTDSGLASETSFTMRAFTMGWMFMLSLKLRHELIGLVGSCFLLQPW